ncbi:hypothetical protein [Streptomyces sp. RPT161]|uniref:hypothetical protein n=1 Tax=Streptomyces sp. RPT161 TaxID=3015993 RepID=UPI0022B8E157|nr:hypothetical protein [Streptomyces sp. RPT161]
MTARHERTRKHTSRRRTAASAAVGSALLTGLMAGAAAPAGAATPTPQTTSATPSGATALTALRHHVQDLTISTPDGSPLGQRLDGVYHDLSRAGVTDWTVVGKEDPGRPAIVLRLWKADAQQVRAVRDDVVPALRFASQGRDIYSAGVLAPVKPGSPAAHGDTAALGRLVARLPDVQATVDPQPDVVYVHLEGAKLTTHDLDAVRNEAARTAGSPIESVRVISEP